MPPVLNCHLCGLQIPNWVDPQHWLAKSVDHIRPRMYGGKKTKENLAPAHRCCNTYRDSLPISDQLKRNCRRVALHHFATISVLDIPPGKVWAEIRRSAREPRFPISAEDLAASKACPMESGD